MAEIGRRGAESTARRLRGGGLNPGELGPLETHEDAKRWLRTIAEAVAVGQLPHRDAQAAIKGVEAWLKAYADGATAKELEALKKKLHEVKQLRRAS